MFEELDPRDMLRNFWPRWHALMPIRVRAKPNSGEGEEEEM